MAGHTHNRFDTLDLLRGIAALAVATFHLARPEGSPAPLPHAYLAVDLFFVLSGFVLAHAYWQPLIDGEPIKRFMLRRLIRLYPLYLIATLVGFALVVGDRLPDGSLDRSAGQWIAALASNLLFLPAGPGSAGPHSIIFPALFPAWSLFWELIANLLFALLAPRLGNRMLGAILAGGLLLLFLTARIHENLNVGAEWVSFWAGGGRVIWGFFAGVALRKLYTRMRPWSARPTWLLVAVFIAVTAAPETGWAHEVLVTAFILPLIVLVGSQANRPSPLGSWLGYTSYAVYVAHVPLAIALKALSLWLTGVELAYVPRLIAVPIFLGLASVLAFLLSRYFDEPVRAWLTRAAFTSKPGSKTAVA